MDRSIRLTLFALLLIVLLIFGLVVGRQVVLVASHEPAPPPELSELNTYVYDRGRALAEFTLTDENGEAVTRENLKGRWTFAFVGYTNCPDICPATLSTLRRADQLISAELPQPDYLLISADPDHDTPAKLKAYLDFFGPDFHGLTGDIEDLRALAKSLNAVFAQRKVDGMTLVDHSAHLALLGPEGTMVAVLQPPHTPEGLAEAFRRIYSWAKQNQEGAG